jgi:hypothetical protein
MDPVLNLILDLVPGLDMDQGLVLEPGVGMESGSDLEAGLSLDPVRSCRWIQWSPMYSLALLGHR